MGGTGALVVCEPGKPAPGDGVGHGGHAPAGGGGARPVFFCQCLFAFQNRAGSAGDIAAQGVQKVGLFLMGIFRLFWKSKEVIYLPTKSVAKEHSIFFDLKHMDALRNLVNSGSFSAGSNIKSEASGNIRMDVILSADKKFAAVQLFQFIPYTYQPITSVQYFTDEQASAVIAFLAKSKMQ